MRKAAKETPLGVLIQTIEECQSLAPEALQEHLTRIGMPEVAHWLLRRNWETQGMKTGAALKALHLHEWTQGLWTQAMNRLTALNRSECEIVGGIDVAGAAMKALAQLEHLKVHWLELELKTDAVRFARGLCDLRRKDTRAYHLLREWMLARKPWEKYPDALSRAALRLALEVSYASDEQAFEDLEVLLSQRNFRRIATFLRFRFQANIELLRRYTAARLRRNDPASGLSEHALFSWFALAWIYCGDMWEEMCLAMHERVETSLSENPLGSLKHSANSYLRQCSLLRENDRHRRTGGRHRLRIALCVFGQLRNYCMAYKSWGVLNLGEHDVHTFVNTWSNTGMRLPCAESGAGCDRVFAHPQFIGAYIRAGYLYGNTAIRSRFPVLHASLSCNSVVDEEGLKSVYGRQAEILIEDDPGEEFGCDPGNQRRMFRKMMGVVQMMNAAVGRFDLCILIRPDLLLCSKDSFSLCNHWEATNKAPVLYNFNLSCNSNLSLDDAFAMGRPDVVSKFADVESQTIGRSWAAPKELVPHHSIAFNALQRGIRPIHPIGLMKGGFSSGVSLSREQILDALRADLPRGIETEMDRLLLASLE